MKNKEISLNTKKNLAKALKNLMFKKSLNKITVTAIINEANVNRKTFYYHFEDINDLLKWIFEEEAVEVVKNFDLSVDYKKATLFVIDYVENNSHILACAYDSLGREEMRRFLYKDFINIIERAVDSLAKEKKIKLDGDFKKFLCTFYSEALAGILIEWFKNTEGNNKEKMADYLSLVFSSSLPGILEDYKKLKDIYDTN